jgi:hypothetical protein
VHEHGPENTVLNLKKSDINLSKIKGYINRAPTLVAASYPMLFQRQTNLCDRKIASNGVDSIPKLHSSFDWPSSFHPSFDWSSEK